MVKSSDIALIIKPTYNCNMNCKYCSVSGHEKKERMSRKTVDLIFNRITDYWSKDTSLHLIWHGGEPLLFPPEFFEYIGQKTKEYKDYRIFNAIQTNGTLLTEGHIDKIVKYNFRFSTSLDGPRHIHNTSRKFRNGAPTFDRVMDSVKMLKDRGVLVGAVAVLSKLNFQYMDEVYHFFNENKINFRINPVLFYGNASQYYDNVAITPKEYGNSLIQLFDLWNGDKNTQIIVDPLFTFWGNIVSGTNRCCDNRKQCHKEVISIGPKGEVYPCGQFHGSQDFYLGNIYRQSFYEIMNGDTMQQLLMRIPEKIAACSICKFNQFCNAGCTASAVCRRGQIMDSDYYCQGRKMIFSHIIKSMDKEINKIKEFSEVLT